MNLNYQTLILKKNHILDELRNVKYNDRAFLVYRLQLTYDDIIDISDIKYFPTKRTGYSLNPGFYEVVDLNSTLKYVLPDNVKLTITYDDIRVKSILKSN